MKLNLNYIVFFGFCIVLLIAFWALATIHTQGAKCIAGPVPYWITSMEKNTGASIMCVCSATSDDPSKQYSPIVFESKSPSLNFTGNGTNYSILH